MYVRSSSGIIMYCTCFHVFAYICVCALCAAHKWEYDNTPLRVEHLEVMQSHTFTRTQRPRTTPPPLASFGSSRVLDPLKSYLTLSRYRNDLFVNQYQYNMNIYLPFFFLSIHTSTVELSMFRTIRWWWKNIRLCLRCASTTNKHHQSFFEVPFSRTMDSVLDIRTITFFTSFGDRTCYYEKHEQT